MKGIPFIEAPGRPSRDRRPSEDRMALEGPAEGGFASNSRFSKLINKREEG